MFLSFYLCSFTCLPFIHFMHSFSFFLSFFYNFSVFVYVFTFSPYYNNWILNKLLKWIQNINLYSNLSACQAYVNFDNGKSFFLTLALVWVHLCNLFNNNTMHGFFNVCFNLKDKRTMQMKHNSFRDSNLHSCDRCKIEQ